MPIQLVDAAFTSLPAASPSPVVRPPFAFTGSDVRVRYDDAPLAHLAYAFPTAGHADPDSVPLQVPFPAFLPPLRAFVFPANPAFQFNPSLVGRM